MKVSSLYAGVQGLINVGLVWFMQGPSQIGKFDYGPLLGVCLVGGLLFVAIRWYVEGAERLLGKGG